MAVDSSSTHGPAISRAGLRLAGVNVAIAAYSALFAYVHILSFFEHRRASLVLLAVFEIVFAACFLARRQARAISASAWEWVTTMGGSFLPLLLRPARGQSVDVLAGEVLQIAGAILITWGILSLNRSIGLLPANRGIRSDGAYRLVRHPLYSGYALLQLGYLFSNVTVANVAILAIAFSCQVARVFNEERLLSRDPEYVAYARETRWRLVPFLF
jgi:protein-S-isoprenylcysteine O-methyltransferase Ste14